MDGWRFNAQNTSNFHLLFQGTSYMMYVCCPCRSKKLTWSACLLDDCLIRFKNTTQFNTLATHKITIAIVIVGWIWWWKKWRRRCSRPGMSSPAVRGCLKATTTKTTEWLLLLKPTACSTLSKRVAWFSLLFSFVFLLLSPGVLLASAEKIMIICF